MSRGDLNDVRKRLWMTSNVDFASLSYLSSSFDQEYGVPAGHVRRSSHPLGSPRDRLDMLKQRWDESVQVILSHAFPFLQPQVGIFNYRTYPVAVSWFTRLLSMYSSEARFYHTLCHLEEIFAYIDLGIEKMCCRVPKLDMVIMNMAVFFHDSVYDVKSSTNEEDSAALFQQFETELLEQSSVDSHFGITLPCDEISNEYSWKGSTRVIQYILATKTHNVQISFGGCDDENGGDRFLHLFLDADISVLGKISSAYSVYASLIRKEYEFVSHSVYCEKRASILEKFLLQPIYKSQILNDLLEQQAVENLQREIELLRNEVIPSISMEGWP